MTPALTRRQALQLGAATSVATFLAGPTALARAVTTSAPRHLLRSTYGPLVGQKFRVGGKLLTLGAVDDLAGAAKDAALRGHPEAFALTFDGPPDALAPVVQTFSHPTVGTCSLLITPVGAVDGGVQRYEVVVDRSVGRPNDPPAPPANRVAAPERPGSEEAAAEALAEYKQDLAAEARQIRRRAARRRRLKRRKLKRRRTPRSRSAAARRRAATKRAAERSRYTAVRRGAATYLD